MLLLWWRLPRRAPDIDTAGVLRSGAMTLLATVPAALVAWILARALTVPGAGSVGRALPGLLASAAFLVVFLASAHLMKHKELRMLWRAARRRAS
jgi:hypothetical protein